MGVARLELARLISQQILSLLCLPIPPYPQELKATPRFELGIEDLQSTALPLGHIAFNVEVIYKLQIRDSTNTLYYFKYVLKRVDSYKKPDNLYIRTNSRLCKNIF